MTIGIGIGTEFAFRGNTNDPEEGLTVTTTYAPLSSMTNTDFDKANPVVFAADFTGLDGSGGGIIKEIGASVVGSYVGFRADGTFVARCGKGSAPWSNETAYIELANGSDIVKGDGTLVIEFGAFPVGPLTVRAWWDGYLLGSSASIANKPTWAGSDTGGYFLNVGAGGVIGEVKTYPVTYTTASYLRHYRNQQSSF